MHGRLDSIPGGRDPTAQVYSKMTSLIGLGRSRLARELGG